MYVCVLNGFFVDTFGYARHLTNCVLKYDKNGGFLGNCLNFMANMNFVIFSTSVRFFDGCWVLWTCARWWSAGSSI